MRLDVSTQPSRDWHIAVGETQDPREQRALVLPVVAIGDALDGLSVDSWCVHAATFSSRLRVFSSREEAERNA